MKDCKIMISRITHAAKMLFCGCMVIMTCSCEDFLTIMPTDRIVSNDFWKTKSDVENVAAESYRLMSQWDFLSRVLVWGELRGDNVVEGNYGGNTDIMNIIDANLLPNNGYASWEPFYKVINNCNIVLANAEAVTNEDPDFTWGDYEVIKGEMHALRALCHFYLVRTFRDIPLLDYAVVNGGQNLYPRQQDPVVVLDACIEDLKIAEKYVLASGSYVRTVDKLKNKGRITKDAVRAMMADVLLWKAAFMAQKAGGDKFVADNPEVQKCYSECIEYCDLVLDTRMNYFNANSKTDVDLKNLFKNTTTIQTLPYPILFAKDDDLKDQRFKAAYGGFAPYGQLFGRSNNALGESLFEIDHTTSAANANYEVPYFYGYAVDNDFKMGMVSASKYLSVVSDGVKDNKKLYAKSDFRRVNYIRSESGESNVDKYPIVKFGYSSAAEDRSSLKKNDPEGDDRKFGKVSYTFWESNSSGGRNYFSDGKVNWIIYRISDVMLMKAEALSLQTGGDLDLAFQLVDVVYSRSQSGHGYSEQNIRPANVDRLDQNKTNYTTSKAMYELVLKERQREFAFEAKRWYDLVRVALHDNSTSRMLDIISLAGNNPEYFKEYRMTMSTINSLFFPISEREIKVSNDGNGPTLKQNEAYETDSDIADNDNGK